MYVQKDKKEQKKCGIASTLLKGGYHLEFILTDKYYNSFTKRLNNCYKVIHSLNDRIRL